MADHYTTLQVTRDADPEVIERAYKALVRTYHPDRRPAAERERATQKMQRINAAYDVLSNPVRRRAYDATLPPSQPNESAWDVFLDRGLVGMFIDRWRELDRESDD